MSLITEPTHAEAAKEYIRQEIKGALQHLEGTLFSCFNRFWNDQRSLPQEILDAFGTNAGQLVQVFGLGKNLVNTLSPGTFGVTSPGDIVVHQDGTATVTFPEPETP